MIDRPEDDPLLALAIAIVLGIAFLLLTDWPLGSIHQRFVPWWPAVLATLIGVWGITPPVRRIGLAIGWGFYRWGLRHGT